MVAFVEFFTPRGPFSPFRCIIGVSFINSVVRLSKFDGITSPPPTVIWLFRAAVKWETIDFRHVMLAASLARSQHPL